MTKTGTGVNAAGGVGSAARVQAQREWRGSTLHPSRKAVRGLAQAVPARGSAPVAAGWPLAADVVPLVWRSLQLGDNFDFAEQALGVRLHIEASLVERLQAPWTGLLAWVQGHEETRRFLVRNQPQGAQPPSLREPFKPSKRRLREASSATQPLEMGDVVVYMYTPRERAPAYVAAVNVPEDEGLATTYTIMIARDGDRVDNVERSRLHPAFGTEVQFGKLALAASKAPHHSAAKAEALAALEKFIQEEDAARMEAESAAAKKRKVQKVAGGTSAVASGSMDAFVVKIS